MGSDSTTDGSWGYFIGHNPGDFTCVMTLKNGDPVTVCDSDGNTRTYSVVDEFIVPDDTYWEDIQSRVTDYGESIILQTCCGDNAITAWSSPSRGDSDPLLPSSEPPGLPDRAALCRQVALP